MRGLLLVFVLTQFIPKAISQNVITYDLEASMDAYTQLWNNDSLLFWGFRDLNNTGTSQASLPGPTIYCEEGDSVIINMTNPSFEAHTIHLHGLDVDQNNDGVPSTSFFVQPNQTGTYSFKADYSGNFLYHCHVGTVLHLQMGMYGAVIVKAANGAKEVYTGGPNFDREFMWLTNEVDKSWHDDYTSIGAFTNYFPDHFQVNGKSKQLIKSDNSISIYGAYAGENLLVRLLNMGYGLNRYIFPQGTNPQILMSDGRVLSNPFSSDTIEVFPGERFGVLIQPTQISFDSVEVQYLSMFRKKLWGKEYIPFNVTSLSNIASAEENIVKVYPNPASNEFYIQGLQTADVFIRDIHGTEVKKQKYDRTTGGISIVDLKPGVYVVQFVTTNNEQGSRLLIKKPH